MSPLAGTAGVPVRLAAPAPGWTRNADVVVVGSGVAGLSVALAAAAHGRVILVTKARLDTGSTRWAQGGIAAALDPADSPAQHREDTEVAGAGLCDPAAVEVLVQEGAARVRELFALGARFDREPGGALSLTREGGHRRRRIVHAGGDATGVEVERALIAAVRGTGRVEVVEHAMVLDLLLGPGGAVRGLTVHVLGEGSLDGTGAVQAGAVVLASGGMGQVYAATTNPPVSTGDGVALGLRAGAVAADLEFVQFHPTALFRPGSSGQQPLVSEALRGEGAVLVDAGGRRVMAGRHPLEDLAPRDVVTRTMATAMRAGGTDHLYLDARQLGATVLANRFPTIVASCRQLGVNPAVDLIPVTPAAHYASGGLRTDLWGRTGVPGLYACGEVACTGVHGANRLASNSLLEGLVFAARIGRALAGDPAAGQPAGLGPAAGRPAGLDPAAGQAAVIDPASTAGVQAAMTEGAGVRRSATSLARAAKELASCAATRGVSGPAAWESTNLLTVARALVAAAVHRQESRGSHWREDHPEPVARWQRHLLTRLEPSGQISVAES